jgi:hypothetical protein
LSRIVAIPHIGRNRLLHILAFLAKEGQDFGEDFLCGDEGRLLERQADRLGRRVPLVAVVEEGDPVIGVGKDTPHLVGRFGVP